VEEIKKMLEKWWPRYWLHNPETWPKQSKMAKKWDFTLLEAYQKTLVKWVEKK
jgi:hypothetical protein